MTIKKGVLIAMAAMIAAVSASAQDDLGEKSGDVPPAQAAPARVDKDRQAVLNAASGDGEALASTQQSKAAVLFVNEGKKPRKWYLVVRHDGDGPQAAAWQLKKPLFEDPVESGDALSIPPHPFPKQPIHLGSKPLSADDAKGAFLMYYPATKAGEAPPSDPRGLFVEEIPTKDDHGGTAYTCLRPILWWGEGMTESAVEDACRKNSFDLVCESSGAASPTCKEQKARKARQAADDPLGGRL